MNIESQMNNKNYFKDYYRQKRDIKFQYLIIIIKYYRICCLYLFCFISNKKQIKVKNLFYLFNNNNLINY